MANLIQSDFSELLSFIENYNLSMIQGNKDYIEIIKRIHKRYYSLLVLYSEIKHQSPDLPIKNDEGSYDEISNIFWEYLEESISELSTSFFILIHGCYKACKQIIRSALENLFKALGCLENIKTITLKKTYEIIGLASEISFFNKSDFEKNIHIGLKQIYGELCASVHTAKIENMQKVSSLGYFPTVDINLAKEVETVYINVVNYMLSIFSMMFKNSFHKMHHKNKDIVQNSLNKNTLTILYKGEYANN